MKVNHRACALCGPEERGPPDSSVHGILQARTLEWAAVSFSGDLPDPGIETDSLALHAGGFFTAEPPGKANS